ncbi:hypothetical protein D6779_04495 [Candidatus Parcubacteria bacterium]|nr:MAG: hypothetical protein D6779_04495 [Candidatus Parcubacteria bacterium]
MKKFSSILAISAIFAGATLSGCSSNAKKDELKSDLQQEQKTLEAKLEKEAQQNVSQMPDWFINPPAVDGEAFYGVGLGEDYDLNDAVKKARLQAYYEIAKNMKSELAGEETMTGNRAGQYRSIINQFVDSTPLAGADTDDTKIYTDKGKYRVYVKLKMPLDRVQQMIEQEDAQTNRQRLEEAYQRLMDKLDKRAELKRQANAPQKQGESPAAEAGQTNTTVVSEESVSAAATHQ